MRGEQRMFRLGNLLTRLWNVFRKRRLEQDLNDELQSDLDLLTEEGIRRGLDPKQAAHAARREFGGVEQTKELYRERRGLTWMEGCLADVFFQAEVGIRGLTVTGVQTCALPISAERAFGHVDILVNNAGCNVRKPALEVTWEDWNLVLDTNLRGSFFVSQAVARGMIARGYGRIINIGSVTSVAGYARLAIGRAHVLTPV